MVVDSSAIVAILLNEEDAQYFRQQLDRDLDLFMAASTLLEIKLVLSGRLVPQAGTTVDKLMRDLEIAIVPFDQRLEKYAFAAFELFGKGRHKAQLNFGDCMSYATAKALNLPLLCKGNDFLQTDLICITPHA